MATLRLIKQAQAQAKGTGTGIIQGVRTIRVKTTPRARVSELSEREDGGWTARVTAPPVDGKANAELLRLVAEHFGCPVSRVWIKSGQTSRIKVVCIEENA